MKFPLFWLITSLFLILFSLHSQDGWRQLTTDDGLSSNVINVIYQDRNDDIWIGTEKGLNRYNGVFETDLSGLVNSIFESPSGQILAREVNDDNTVRINVFDGLEWNEPDFLDDNDIIVPDIREYLVVSGGKLWMSTRDGLVGYDGRKWQLYAPDVSVDWLVKTPDGQLWSESWRQGIVSFDGQKWNLEFNTDNTPLKSVKVNTVLATSNGMILLGTDEGLLLYDPDLNELYDLVLGKVRVNKILESRDGNIWVCTEGEKKKKDSIPSIMANGRLL